MKTLTCAVLAAGLVVGIIGSASAQYYGPGYGAYPQYRDYPRLPRLRRPAALPA